MRTLSESVGTAQGILPRDRNLPKATYVALTLALGALGALPLVFLTPPFQVPDENWHFYRAYEISELKMRSEVQNGLSGAVLPESLPELVRASIQTVDELHFPATPAPLAQTWQHRSLPLNPSVRRFVAFPGSAFYSPLPYLPQALGIAAGRLSGFGPLGLLYMGRLFNCLAALSLVAFSIYIVPFAREVMLLIGLLPMSLYLFASQSADASLIASALVFSALALVFAVRGSWRGWELAVASTAAAVFCSVKPVYFPLLLAGLVPYLFQRGKTPSVIRSHVVLLTVAMATTAGWMMIARSSMTSPLTGAHPSEQLRLILHNPGIFFHALLNCVKLPQILAYYCMTVGAFGWLTVLMPWLVYLLPLIGFSLICYFGIREQVEFPRPRRLWLLSLATASALLVLVAMYLIAARVGEEHIIGVQGRYFLPILAFALIPTVRLAPMRPPRMQPRYGLAILVLIIILEIAAMDATIFRAFHIL